jgi:integrase
MQKFVSRDTVGNHNAGMRANEIRLLTWEKVDFLAKSLVVGKSKTAAGTGRIIPLNLRAIAMLTYWRGLFPNAQRKDFAKSPHIRQLLYRLNETYEKMERLELRIWAQ